MPPRSVMQRGAAAANARRRAQTHSSDSARTCIRLPEGVSAFAVKKAGVYRLDIMPYIVGEGNPCADKGAVYFERTFWVHRGVGANNEMYVCPAKTANLPCPICQWILQQRKDPNADEDTIKSLLPKERQLFNVIDVTSKAEEEKGVQIWDISFHLFGKLLDDRLKNQEDGDNFDSFCECEGGKTLRCTFVEKSWNGNSFCETSAIDFKNREADYDPEQTVDAVYCLDDLLIIAGKKDSTGKVPFTYERLKEIFLQVPEVSSDKEEPAQEERSARSLRKPASRPEPEPEPDLVDEDDIPFEEPEPEPEPPKKKTLATKPKQRPAPEPEPEPEPEEEAEPEPPSRAAAARKQVAAPTRKSTSQKCPHGGTFGVDTDKLKECRKCLLWDPCDDAKAG